MLRLQQTRVLKAFWNRKKCQETVDLTRVSKQVPGAHGKRGLERGWQKRLAKGWRKVGEGLNQHGQPKLWGAARTLRMLGWHLWRSETTSSDRQTHSPGITDDRVHRIQECLQQASQGEWKALILRVLDMETPKYEQDASQPLATAADSLPPSVQSRVPGTAWQGLEAASSSTPGVRGPGPMGRSHWQTYPPCHPWRSCTSPRGHSPRTMARGWRRVGKGFPCTLQFCDPRGARLETLVWKWPWPKHDCESTVCRSRLLQSTLMAVIVL